jgi:hypothetical protein
LDQESGQAFWLSLDDGGWRALDLLLMIGLPLLLWHFFAVPVARYALAAGLAESAVEVLCPGGEIQFLCCRLRPFGICLPLFCLLLVRSWWQHTVRSQVAWKGRAYSTAKAMKAGPKADFDKMLVLSYTSAQNNE